MITPDNVSSIYLEATCVGIGQRQWNKFMKKATIADKRKVNKIIKDHLPDDYEKLALQFYNPYRYYKTDKHLILVHSHIEYFYNYQT